MPTSSRSSRLAASPTVSPASTPPPIVNQEELELQTISKHGWWYGDDLEATGQAAHVTIPALLRQAADAITLRRAS